MRKILQKESQILRKISKEIKVLDIKSAKVQKIISEMKESLDSQSDGVAIAAPQIGYNSRIFVVSGKVVDIINSKNTEKDLDSEPKKFEDSVFINPVIRKISKEKKTLEEGCLSVRYLYGQVLRSKKVTVEAYDENAKKFVKPATGLMAQIFQHEIDHLNGILFIDKAENLEDIPPIEKKGKNGKELHDE